VDNVINTKHLAFFFAVFLLTVIGVSTVMIDVIVNHQLHVTNAVVGFLSILLALGFALPLRLKVAIRSILPLVEKIKPSDITNAG
jgi:hypothetical protein